LVTKSAGKLKKIINQQYGFHIILMIKKVLISKKSKMRKSNTMLVMFTFIDILFRESCEANTLLSRYIVRMPHIIRFHI
jgi:hypothetical protein